MTDLRHVDCWVFDLDNTLYPARCNLFRQIDARMSRFIEERLGAAPDDARRMQKDFYVRYGTTMAGLMTEHGVCPRAFMDFVHDIDLEPVKADRALRDGVTALPGRKFVFTNGSVKHAENVLSKLDLADAFDDIFDIECANWRPKPHPETYDAFLAAHAVDPRGAAMFDDLAHNLAAAFDLGMTTVLVASEAEWIDDEPEHKRPARIDDRHDHVHHVTDDLAAFLAAASVSERAS
jgi:putative hydrolase of the HAD superfamily